MPPHVVLQKAWLRVKPRLYEQHYRRHRLARGATRANNRVAEVIHSLAGLLVNPGAWQDQGYASRVARRAAVAVGGRFAVLGYGETDIPTGAGWRTDPFHEHEWKLDFFSKVDFVAAGSRCDVKIPWELSRLQFLVWLAQGARSTDGSAATCLANFEAILVDWIAANPAGFGVNWSCGMEVAIRSVNLVFAAALIADRLSEAVRRTLVQSLYEHRDFLRRFPEYSDVPGNHYLADLMGIAVLDRALDGPVSRSFARSAAKFASEADRQFEPSGIHLEHSTVYHRLCMDMVAIVHAISGSAEDQVGERLSAVLERGLRFADGIASPGGLLPMFGDCDSGHILWFGGDARRIDALRAYCCGEAGDGGQDDFARFLRGFRADADPKFKRSSPAPGIYGPLVTLRADPMTLIARHGGQGLGGRAPHDHDDALSFWAFLSDDDLFVDMGTLGYTLDEDDRRAAIVSTAHPIWSPPGRERFAPVKGSVFVTVRGAPDATVEFGSADGSSFCELEVRGSAGNSLMERRTLTLCDRLQIDDRIELGAPAALEMVLRLGPAFTAEADSEGTVMILGHNWQCRLRLDSNVRVEFGEEIWGPQYGHRQKISAIRLRSARNLVHAVSLTVCWEDRGDARLGEGIE